MKNASIIKRERLRRADSAFGEIVDQAEEVHHRKLKSFRRPSNRGGGASRCAERGSYQCGKEVGRRVRVVQ